MHLVRDDLHRPTRPGGGKTDVVAVHRGGAAIEPLVARVAYEAQPHVRLIVQIRHGAPQALRVAGRNDRAPVRKLQRRDAAPRWVINLRDHFGARIRAELGPVGQLLQRVVVPELHLDAAVLGASLSGVVRGERRHGTPAVARERGARQLEGFLHGERHAVCARLRERDEIAVNALIAPRQRHLVRVADELDHDVRLVPQVVQCLLDLLDELRRDLHVLLVVVQWRNDIAHACPPRRAFLEAQLAERLHPADLDLLDLLSHEHFLVRCARFRLVVPDFHLHAAIECPALGGVVRCNGVRIAGPLVREGLRLQLQCPLEEFRHLARALARQSGVVPEGSGERRGQPLVVGMADQVQAHIAAIAQALESLAQRLHVIVGNLRHSGFEMNGRNDVLELHGLEALGQHLPRLEPVARLGPDLLGVPRPWRERLFHGQLPLDRAAEWRLADALRLCARGDERQTGEEPAATLAHAAHLAPRSRSAGSLGGLPRSQKTSRSIVSS